MESGGSGGGRRRRIGLWGRLGFKELEEGYGRGLGFKNDTSGEVTFLVAYGPSN